jgi:hypothetical protein
MYGSGAATGTALTLLLLKPTRKARTAAPAVWYAAGRGATTRTVWRIATTAHPAIATSASVSALPGRNNPLIIEEIGLYPIRLITPRWGYYHAAPRGRKQSDRAISPISSMSGAVYIRAYIWRIYTRAASMCCHGMYISEKCGAYIWESGYAELSCGTAMFGHHAATNFYPAFQRSDRVVHHALVNVLEPVFEKIFIADSYATRKDKGVHAAVFRAQHEQLLGHAVVLSFARPFAPHDPERIGQTTKGSGRVIRGGSWSPYPQHCRVAYRFSYAPGFRNGFIGFRLARTK